MKRLLEYSNQTFGFTIEIVLFSFDYENII